MTGPVATDFDHNSCAWSEQSLWQAYRDLQAAGPVGLSEASGGFYVLSRFDDVKAALKDSETFASGHGHRIPVVGTPRAMPIDYDPPLHTDYRRMMVDALRPGRVQELVPFLRGLIERLLEDFRRAGGGDAVTQVALPLPLQVLTEVVGFSDETVRQLRRLTELMWEQVNEVDYDEARRDLRAVIDAEIARHRGGAIDDYLTGLLTAEVAGRPITDDEAARALLTFAIAGHETTMNAATSLLWVLANDHDLQDRLRADPSLAPAYVEEVMRLRTPSHNFARHTTRDTEVQGVEIPADSRVLLCYAAANRDPERYPDPDRFEPDRPSRGHVGFGWGIHHCIGAGLARTELRLLLETLCHHPPFEPAGETRFSQLQGGIHYGPVALPLRFIA